MARTYLVLVMLAGGASVADAHNCDPWAGKCGECVANQDTNGWVNTQCQYCPDNGWCSGSVVKPVGCGGSGWWSACNYPGNGHRRMSINTSTVEEGEEVSTQPADKKNGTSHNPITDTKQNDTQTPEARDAFNGRKMGPRRTQQSSDGQTYVDCEVANSRMGKGGRCICEPNFQAIDGNCVAQINGDICPPGHECGSQCFDGKDNDGDGVGDCEDPDCQFDQAASVHCHQFGFGTNDDGTCNLVEAQLELKRIENFCCPAGDCKKIPDLCDNRCSRVFNPFWQTCSSSFKTLAASFPAIGNDAREMVAGLDQLYTLCQEKDQAVSAGQICAYDQYLPVALACSDYIAGTKLPNSGSEEFCSTKCFEAAHAFSERCGSGMTHTFSSGLGVVLPYMQHCVHSLAPNNDGSQYTHAVCPTGITQTALAVACPDTASKTGCTNQCSRFVHGLSTVCQQEQAFTPYVQAQASCTSVQIANDCTALGTHFNTLLLQNCCGSDGCVKKVPAICSAACADSFLPFYNQCGRVVYGDNPTQSRNIGILAAKCARINAN